MAPRTHMSSGRLSQGLLLLCVLLGTGLCHTDTVTTNFSQNTGTSPPTATSSSIAQPMEELHRHHTALLGLLCLPDEECADIGAVRVESHQQALQRAAALPGGVGRAPQPQLPQRPGRAVHLPEPPPLLPQLHPGAPGVLRPSRRRAPGYDHRTHLPHPLPCHPGHLAQQGRQGAGLELPSRTPGCGTARPPGWLSVPPIRAAEAAGSSRAFPSSRPGIKRFSPHAWRWFFGRSIPPGPGPGQLPPPAPSCAGVPAAPCRGERSRRDTGTRTEAAGREGRGLGGA